MKALIDHPAFLLLATGVMIGLTFPFGKIAGAAGVPPIDWAFLIAISATVLLAPAIALLKITFPINARLVRYALISGAISYVVPNLLLFASLPHLGAGYTGLFYTLSPVMTLGMSVGVGMRPPGRLAMAGVAVGFAGALLLAYSRGDADAPADWAWIGVAFLIPVSLAVGNVYRTLDWPEGTHPLVLAVASNAAAALMLLLATVVVNGMLPGGFYPLVPVLTAVQAVAAAFQFVVFFRLQKVGGPLYLSQIGYVAAAVGLFSGMVFLGERYGLATWIGAAIIALGIGLTIRAQMRTRAS